MAMNSGTTDLYFFDPYPIRAALVEMGESSVCIDKASWHGYKGPQSPLPDPVTWHSKVFAHAPKRRLLYLDYPVAIVFDETATSLTSQPVAVYPQFNFYSQRVDDLVFLLDNPWGTSLKYTRARVPAYRRPVEGQDHVIVITGVPNSASAEYAALASFLRWAMESYDVKFIIHSEASGVGGLNMGAHGVTHDVNVGAEKGVIVSQYGSMIRCYDRDNLEKYSGHLAEIGFTPDDLYTESGQGTPPEVALAQRKYGIAAARFAAYYWHQGGTPGSPTPRQRRPDVGGGSLEEFVAQVVRKKLRTAEAG